MFRGRSIANVGLLSPEQTLVGRSVPTCSQRATTAGLFARYADCLLAQILQSTACNATHSIEQRAAKWIIAAAERTGPERVPLTHEQLGMLLGVGRSYASRVVKKFRVARLVETRRKAFVIKNAEGLQTKACLCDTVSKRHFDEVMDGLYPKDD